MKNLKSILAIVISACLILCLAGCGDDYSNFKPTGVRIVESIGGNQYETTIDDQTVAQEMWSKFDDIVIDTEQRGEVGSAYLYMCFYNEDQSTLGIFTIYENGSCCLGEDFSTFYIVENGQNVYAELCDIYTNYESQNSSNAPSNAEV